MEIEYELNTDKLANSIQILAENPDRLINNLEGELLNKYLEIKDIVSKLYKTSNYQILIDLINQQYRPTILYPGTLGAYLWGCFSNYYGSVNQTCSPLCINSIPSLNQKEACHYQIWRYSMGRLIRNTDTNNNRAYIYVNEDWVGFSKDDVTMLKNNNVLYATILTTKNTKHLIKIPMSHLDEIPLIDKLKKEYFYKKSENSYLYVYLIISLLLIILCGYIYWIRKK